MKQADVVLLGFPLMHPMSPEVRRNDLETYEPATEPGGPAMTWVRRRAKPKWGPPMRWLSPSELLAASPSMGTICQTCCGERGQIAQS